MKQQWIRILIVPCLVMTAAGAGLAAEKKFELGLNLGYTASEGVEISPRKVGIPPETIDRLSPKSGGSWGLNGDFFLSENLAAGFLFSQQMSKLTGHIQEVDGDRDFADMSVFNYHATLTYHFGDPRAKMRPYFFGGMGATQYNPGDIGGQPIDGETRFSTTWGGGVKYFASEKFGFKAGVRWTPTYIKSDPTGVWCSPYWPGDCWVLGEPNYSQQFELNAGIFIRF